MRNNIAAAMIAATAITMFAAGWATSGFLHPDDTLRLLHSNGISINANGTVRLLQCGPKEAPELFAPTRIGANLYLNAKCVRAVRK